MRLRIRVQEVTDPGQRQIAQNIVGGRQVIEFHQYAGRGDQGRMRVADALGLAGRTRGVQDDGDVGGVAEIDFGEEKIRVGGIELAAQFLQGGERLQLGLGVVAQTAFIVDDHVPQQVHQVRLRLLDLE